MRPIVRPGNDHSPRRNRAAWGVFFTLVPAGGLIVAALVAGIIAAGVSA